MKKAGAYHSSLLRGVCEGSEDVCCSLMLRHDSAYVVALGCAKNVNAKDRIRTCCERLELTSKHDHVVAVEAEMCLRSIAILVVVQIIHVIDRVYF